MEKQYLSIPEAAKLLGVSRIAVYKKVKKGQIKAAKIGRNFAIPRETLSCLLGHALSDKEKREIEKGVRRTVREYGETLKLLGRE